MGGPIVRSGATPEFSKNWESVFGKKSKTASTATKSKPAKPAKKKAAKKGKK